MQWQFIQRFGWVLVGAFLMAVSLQMSRRTPCDCALLRSEARIEKKQQTSGAHNQSSVTGKSVNATRKAVNFLRDPDAMVKAFRDCGNDADCHFVFHHAFKTGGTTIESVFESVFQQKHQKTCCNEEILEIFWSKPEYFCHAKFSSWQVHSDEFWGVVESCANMLLKEPSGKNTRWVVLTTFREVIEMTVSHIHQRCNKNLHRRPPKILEACRACDYSNHTDVWDGYVDEINHQVASVYNVAHYLAPNRTLPFDRIKVYTMEPNDIDDFFYQWNPKYHFPPRNREELGTCNFRVPSIMMKKLRPAQALYRQLMTGIDF